MRSELYDMYARAQDYYDEDGVVAIVFDTSRGPRTMAQGWTDCKEILMPAVCWGDTFRVWVVWNHNWNQPRVDLVRVLNKAHFCVKW